MEQWHKFREVFEPKTNIYIKNCLETIAAVEKESSVTAKELKTAYGIKDKTPLLELEYHIIFICSKIIL